MPHDESSAEPEEHEKMAGRVKGMKLEDREGEKILVLGTCKNNSIINCSIVLNR